MNSCVRAILITLSRPVLQALRTAIDGILTALQAQLAALTAKAAVLDIALAPIQASRDLAVETINTLRAPLDILPTSLVRGCADLGDVKQDIADAAATATARVEEFADDATRLLSVKARLQAEIDYINEQVARLSELQTEIDTALTLV